MGVTHRLIASSAVVLLACALCAIILPARSEAQPQPQVNGSSARVLFDAVNKERETQGLPALKWDEGLAGAADRHARRMAEKDSLSHQFPAEEDAAARARRAGALFSKIAENVGLAQSTAVLHQEWMKSPPHRANILDRETDSLGIAVVERNGVLFAVEDFSRAVTLLSVEEQEKQIGALLNARGMSLLNDIPNELAVARKQCSLDSGMPAGKRRQMMIYRYTTTDLSRLPTAVEKKIPSGRYRAAVVGACPPNAPNAFTNYRLAILLY